MIKQCYRGTAVNGRHAELPGAACHNRYAIHHAGFDVAAVANNSSAATAHLRFCRSGICANLSAIRLEDRRASERECGFVQFDAIDVRGW